MTENNAKQADFPEGADVLPNPLGTAPGFMLEIEGSLLFCTPGVPRELYRMVDEEILPRIAARQQRGGAVRAALLRTFGVGESVLDQELGDLAQGDPSVQIGFRTQFPDNLVRVVARGPDVQTAQGVLENLLATIRARLGPLVIGEGERRLEAIVAELLLEKQRTIAVAESCTGGLVASLLTDTPGSSGYFRAGVVAYSNESKLRELGVSPDALRTHGAVSEPVARQMAENVRARTGADIGLATTGIAGPDGGSDEKPVGTLYVALATDAHTECRRYQLLRERARNKTLSAQIALEWVRRTLLGLPIPDETFPRTRAIRSQAAQP
jgi:nicotinamide-nucleotide amidase